MSDAVVRVDDVSKRYRLGPTAVPLRTLVPRLRDRDRTLPREIWALRDVSFEAFAGSIVGVIGANGAGKSTLLKVLARVTRPTTGTVGLRGRVVPLLELGGTFRPDVSGRDNVYLNASLYGIPRSVVRRRIDDIVDFSGIGDLVDAPVRTYSTGMHLRLAFACAVSLEPDILVADEVLAVGDLAFQLQCSERIRQDARQGLSALMVSHDLASVREMCDRAIWIDGGTIRADGPAADVVAAYEASVTGQDPQAAPTAMPGLATPVDTAASDVSASTEHVNEFGEILALELIIDGEPTDMISTAETARVRITVRVDRPGIALRPILVFSTPETDAFRAVLPAPLQFGYRGAVVLELDLPAHLLAATSYSVKAGVWISHEGEELREHALVLRQLLTFRVRDPAGADPTRGTYMQPLNGAVRPLLQWSARGADSGGAESDREGD